MYVSHKFWNSFSCIYVCLLVGKTKKFTESSYGLYQKRFLELFGTMISPKIEPKTAQTERQDTKNCALENWSGRWETNVSILVFDK